MRRTARAGRGPLRRAAPTGPTGSAAARRLRRTADRAVRRTSAAAPRPFRGDRAAPHSRAAR